MSNSLIFQKMSSLIIVFINNIKIFFALQNKTRIKFLTDGVLLREMMDDPLLTNYRYSIVNLSFMSSP